MEKYYTLYCGKNAISEKMSMNELLEKLYKMQLNFKYYSSINCLIIFENNYWYLPEYKTL